MNLHEDLVLSAADAETLLHLLADCQRQPEVSGHSIEALTEILQSADIVTDQAMLEGRVGLNETVSCVETAGGATHQLRIVSPDAASPEAGHVSVLSPMAIALLGRRVGEQAKVTLPNGGERHLDIRSLQADRPDKSATPSTAVNRDAARMRA